MQACAACGRALAAGEGAAVPGPVKVVASAALAFLHGGLWVHEELSREYCRRCRRLVSAAVLAAAALILTAAAFGVGLLLTRLSGR